MKKKPYISIITATYNAGDYLESSINSIINQTFKDYEYIIIDGCSSDSTIDIIGKYEKYITYWESDKDSGIYDAWNKGISKSQGEWILFIGADDQLLPNGLEIYVNYITSFPKNSFDYVSSRVKRINPDGSIEGIVGKPWKWNSFRKKMTTAHPGSFHSKQFFETYGLYQTKYSIVSDYEILLRAKDNLKTGYIDKITVLMSTGTNLKKSVAIKEILDVLKYSNNLSFWEYHFMRLRVYIGSYLKRILIYLK